MANLRMIDPFAVEDAIPNKQLTIRERQVIRNILADVVGKDTSTVAEQVADYLKYKDCDFQHSRIEQDDEEWLKVDVFIGELGKRTMYEFKARHPKNQKPTD